MGGMFMALSSVLGAVSQVATGFSQAKAMNFQAQQAMLQGEADNINAKLQAAQQQQQSLRLMSSQVAQGAAAGVDVTGSTSSLISIIDDSQRQARDEREIMLQQGRVAQANANAAAAQYKSAASAYKRQGLISGGATLVGGLYKAGAFDGFDNIFSGGGSSAVTSTSGYFNTDLASKSIPKWNY